MFFLSSTYSFHFYARNINTLLSFFKCILLSVLLHSLNYFQCLICKDKTRSRQHVDAAHNTDTKLHGIIILSQVILVFSFFHAHSQTSQDICCVVFALFNVVWATLFLERWKRREAELAYRWGTLDTPAESLEEPRPQFRVSRDC